MTNWDAQEDVCVVATMYTVNVFVYVQLSYETLPIWKMQIHVSVCRGNCIPRSYRSSSFVYQRVVVRSRLSSLSLSRQQRVSHHCPVIASVSRFSDKKLPFQKQNVLTESISTIKEWFAWVLHWCRVLIPLSFLAFWNVTPGHALAMSPSRLPVHVIASVSDSIKDTEIGWSDILHYKFQRLMAQQMFGKLLAVLLAALPIVMIGGISYKIITGSKLMESMFKAYSIMGDVPGADAVQEESSLALFIGNLIFVTGMLTVAVTIGIVCDDISTFVSEVRHGNYQIVEKDHMVAEASKERGGFNCPIVILADFEKDEIEDAIAHEIEGLNLNVFTRRGCTHDAMDLKRVAAGQAKYIIWLEPDDDDEVSLAARRACAIASIKALGTGRSESAKLVVQTSHNSVNSAAQLTNVPLAFRTPPVDAETKLDVMELYEEENFDRLLAQCVLQPGLSVILSDICQHNSGKEFYMSAGKGFGGQMYSVARRYFRKAAVCGIFTPPKTSLDGQGRVQLNPADDTVLQTDDRLILLCNSSKETAPSSTPVPQTGASVEVADRERPSHFAKNIVVLCFGAEGNEDSGALESIAMFAPKGTNITVVANSTSDLDSKTGECKMSFVKGNPASFSTLVDLSDREIDCVVLAGLEDLPQKIADAQLISSLIQIQEVANTHWKDHGGVRVVSPLNFKETKQVANHLISEGQALKAPVGLDVLLPSELISGMVVQVTGAPMLDMVFKELMKDKGNEIYIRDVTEFGLIKKGILKSYEVADIVRQHQESFLGILKKDGSFEIPPEATTEHQYTEEEKIVVLSNTLDSPTES